MLAQMKEFDEIWRRWIQKNVREGCSKDVLFKILHDSGFAFDAIRSELGHEPAWPLRVIFGPTSVWDGAASGAGPRGDAADRGFEDWLDPGPSIECPEWIRKGTRQQQTRVPYLGAGGRACRGFEKRRMDDEVFAEIRGLFESARHRLEEEKGDAIGAYLCSVGRGLPPALSYAEPEFNAVLAELLRPLHEEWCGFELEPVSCYGFRVYLHGAYLHEHVDRQDSHVVSSSLCVSRELYAPWPLRVEDVDGVRHDVDLEPGEFVLYESARIAHGRPVPLNGRHHAALFVHYRPARDRDLWLESPSAWWAKHGGPAAG
jgi:hypothetical protein